LPERPVVVTFDDGYADNLLNARPVLEEAHVPATFFLVSGRLGSSQEFWWDELERLFLSPGQLPRQLELVIAGRKWHWDLGEAADYEAESHRRYQDWRAWEPAPTPRHAVYLCVYDCLYPLLERDREIALHRLRLWAGTDAGARPTHRTLTRAEAQMLVAGERFELGAHTATHPCLSALDPAAQREEIRQSKIVLQELGGRPVASFAYPFGRLRDYSAETIALLKEAGFQRACSSFAGKVSMASDLFQLPRMVVVDWDGEAFARKLADWFEE
jgi:peptidoglycan/xylan/chitin deacetylase (PgdA/CDA1 family)